MKKLHWVLPLFLVFLLVAFFHFSSLAPNSDTTKKVFVINEGDSLTTIAGHLEKYSFIRNSYSFLIYSRILGLNKKIQAGTFYLSTSEKLPDLIQKLATGGSTDYWFKIIPGTRLEQFSPDVEFTQAAKKLDGQLFPDSYLIPQDYTPENILAVIAKNYQQKLLVAKIDATTQNSDNEALIIASLLEREAKLLNDKKIIAGIIQNRLDAGIALQIDATVQYARDSLFKPKTYWQILSKSDLSIVSPYNTYKNRGLPPGPICNPGSDSLFAAYHPAKTDYLYYLNDHNGQIHYAKTLDEHNANVAKYLR